MADSVHDIRTPVSQTSPDPSRRTILAGLPAAAVGVGALAAPAFAAAAHPDAALLALEPDLKALKAQAETARDAFDAAERNYQTERDRLPLAGRHRWGVLDRLETKHKAAAAKEDCEDADLRLRACLGKVSELRATTLDGLKFKARWAEEDDDVQLSIIDDLRAL